MSLCPHCGQPMPEEFDELRVNLKNRTISTSTYPPTHVSPKLLQLLMLFLKNSGGPLTISSVQEELKTTKNGAIGCIQRLRKILPVGYVIQSVWGVSSYKLVNWKKMRELQNVSKLPHSTQNTSKEKAEEN